MQEEEVEEAAANASFLASLGTGQHGQQPHSDTPQQRQLRQLGY